MKIMQASFLMLILFNTISFSAGLDELRFGGYLENRTTLTIAPDEIVSDVAQLRLEGAWDYGMRGGVETNVIVSAALKPLDPFETVRESSVTGKALNELIMLSIGPAMRDLQAADSLADSSGMSLSVISQKDLDRLVKYLPYSSFYPDDQVLLDRALVKLYFKPFDLFAGKQIVAWGTGYAFNPTDVWNTKNPLDADAPKTGVNALRLEIPLGAVSGISLVASPGRDFSHASGGFRYKTNFQRFDISICAMRIMNSDRELLGLPKKIMAGADMAGQIGDVGVWAEAALNNPVYDWMEYTDFDSSYVQADIGLDYTFENGLYCMLEYYYNGLGRDDADDYGARDLVNLFAGETSGFAAHYLFGGTRFDIIDRFNISLFALGNLTDHSAMLVPSVEYLHSDNITLQIGAQAGIGDKQKSEYGGVYPNAFLTIRGYF
jgi:hypothetical protein